MSVQLGKHLDFGASLELTRQHLAPVGTASASASYQLAAVIAHHGKQIQSGHYTCDMWVEASGPPLQPLCYAVCCDMFR